MLHQSKPRILVIDRENMFKRKVEGYMKTAKNVAIFYIEMIGLYNEVKLYDSKKLTILYDQLHREIISIDSNIKTIGSSNEYRGNLFLAYTYLKPNEISSFILKLNKYFNRHIHLEDEIEINLQGKIGYVICSDEANTTQNYIEFSRIATHFALRTINNSTVKYVPQLKKKFERERKIRSLLTKLNKEKFEDNEDFSLHYQPQVNWGGKIKGLEALLRWNTEEVKNVGPEEFIPIAESCGSIVTLGEFVLARTKRDYNSMIKQGVDRLLKMSVNLSPRQLDGNFLTYVKKLFRQTEFKPENLELEITEKHILKSEHYDLLIKLKKLGISIALDDFGKGYTNIERLNGNMPFSVLKVDRLFIQNIHNGSQGDKVKLESIINLSRAFKMKIVFEGIECEEELKEIFKLLNREKLGLIQGFYFSKPQCLEDTLRILIKEHPFREKIPVLN